MDRNFYKQAAISHVIITGWIIYAFFDYLRAQETGFENMVLLFLFLGTSMLVSGSGVALMIFRLTRLRKLYKTPLSGTLVYVFTGLANAYLTVIWIIAVAMGLLKIERNIISVALPLVPLLSAAFILTDIYTAIFKNSINVAESAQPDKITLL